MTLRLCFALGGTDFGRSGLGTYVRAVLPRLREQIEATSGSLFVLGTPSELDAYARETQGVEHALLPAAVDRPGASALAYLAASDLLARKHRANCVLYPVATRRFRLVGTLPSVAVVHDLGQLHVPEKYSPARMFYFRHVILRLLQSASELVAISGATRDDLMRTLGLSADAIRVVPNGVDVERFAPLADSNPRLTAMRQALTLEGRYVLYPARLEHPGKNHLRLVRAFAASQLRSSHKLVLAGADWGARALIEDEARRAGIADRVRILGFVDDELVPPLIAAADGVVMVGLAEGFGLPALEALASGRPVCAATAGALPEVVGPLAALCDPLDEASITTALERVVSDPDLRSRAESDGPSWAAARSWASTATGLHAACLAAVG